MLLKQFKLSRKSCASPQILVSIRWTPSLFFNWVQVPSGVAVILFGSLYLSATFSAHHLNRHMDTAHSSLLTGSGSSCAARWPLRSEPANSQFYPQGIGIYTSIRYLMQSQQSHSVYLLNIPRVVEECSVKSKVLPILQVHFPTCPFSAAYLKDGPEIYGFSDFVNLYSAVFSKLLHTPCN